MHCVFQVSTWDRFSTTTDALLFLPNHIHHEEASNTFYYFDVEFEFVRGTPFDGARGDHESPSDDCSSPRQATAIRIRLRICIFSRSFIVIRRRSVPQTTAAFKLGRNCGFCQCPDQHLSTGPLHFLGGTCIGVPTVRRFCTWGDCPILQDEWPIYYIYRYIVGLTHYH